MGYHRLTLVYVSIYGFENKSDVDILLFLIQQTLRILSRSRFEIAFFFIYLQIARVKRWKSTIPIRIDYGPRVRENHCVVFSLG